LNGHPFHIAGRKYADAVRLAGGLPLIVPRAEADEIDGLLEMADGVLLTGSPSNVHPRHFGEDVFDPALPLDADRDSWTLPLIPRALALGVPLFAICRGFQETNVALGGSLHQAVHQVPGRRDHRAAQNAAPEMAYALAHPVDVMPGGTLAGILGERRVEVNSVHGQGVNRLADGLRVEARAPDFNLCVQWHPEWQAASNPVSMQLLRAFGQACRERHQRRNNRRTTHE
jgi:putative glutamine amidotransferase